MSTLDTYHADPLWWVGKEVVCENCGHHITLTESGRPEQQEPQYQWCMIGKVTFWVIRCPNPECKTEVRVDHDFEEKI